jgi:hypothetical protein
VAQDIAQDTSRRVPDPKCVETLAESW